MRITLTAAAMLLLWMCDSEPPLPPAAHGGVVVSVGSQPLEVVAHADGQLTAYPLAPSATLGPSTTVLVHVPGVDGTVHDAPLAWDAPTATFVGSIPVAPRVGPIEIDAVVEGAPVHASAPVFVVLAPVAPVVVGTAPSTVEVVGPHHPGHVEVVAPQRPGVVVVPPAPPGPPGVVVLAPEPPRPVVLVPPPPPGPPGVVFVAPGPPRPGIIVEDRDGRIDEGRGHWDHGRHGGAGPEWHEGGGGGGGHGRHGR